jgi:hypothetical protein
MRSGAGAVLVPALNMKAWEEGLACRIALFKDFGWEDEEGNEVQDVRFAQALKAEGSIVPEERSKVIAFSIVESGLSSLALPTMLISTPTFRSPIKRSPHPLSQFHNQPPTSTPTLPTLPQKRKFEDTGFEIPDSDDEDYGWEQDDEEELPPPPPQWQGSEDILGPGMGLDEEEGFEKDEELNELAGDPSPGVEAENVGQELEEAPRRPIHWSSTAQATFGTHETLEPEDVLEGKVPPPPLNLTYGAGYEREQKEGVGPLPRVAPDLIPDSDSEDELAA